MIIDIIIVLFIALMAFIGKRRGLIKTLIGFFSSFIAAAASYFLLPGVVNALKPTPIYKSLLDAVSENVADRITPDTSSLPEIISNGIRKTGEAAVNSLSQSIASIIIGIALFFIIIIALKLLLRLLVTVFKLPVLKQVNSIGGFVFGIALSFVIIYTVLAIWGCSTAFNLPAQLKNTELAKSMFQNNLLLIFFSLMAPI